MAGLINQLKQVVRRLVKAPLFTAITLITLAVGIGANTAVFSVIEGVLLKPLPYPHPEQLIGVWEKAPAINLPEIDLGEFEYFIYREQNRTFQDIGAYKGNSLSVTGTGEPEHVQGMNVTDGTLPLLGVKPLLGRLFTRADDSPDAQRTIILSYGYWQRRFGGSASVIGRNLTVDGNSQEIIGVLPRDFQFLDTREADLFLPFRWKRSEVKLGSFSYEALARLKPGVTMEQASADVARMIPITNRSFPPPLGYSLAVFEHANIQPNLHPLKKVVTGDVGNVLWVLMGSIAVVLIVACANVANLLLVRVEGRSQELAIRAALGAARKDIVSELLLESLVLGLAGGLIGLALAFAALRVLVAAAPIGLPRLNEIGVDLPVLLFAFAITLFVSLVIGLIPVLKYSGVRMTTGLREGGRSLSQSRERHRARKALVVVQVALALVLLICSGLMIRTFRAMTHVSPGFSDPATLETFSIEIPEADVPDTQLERVVHMEQAIDEQLAALPGVNSAAITTVVPLSGNMNFDPVYAQDRNYKPGEIAPLRWYKFVSPGFFSTLGTPVIAGRDFTWAETYQKQPMAIISENFAREYWGSPANALGKRISEDSRQDWHVIVGVVRDIYDEGLSKPAPTAVYWPLYQNHFNDDKEDMIRRWVSFVIRTPRAGSAAFIRQVQQAVWTVDPDLPLANVATLGEFYTKSMARTSFMLVMLCAAGAMALLLGIVGIYGVISYAVSQRTREIGIRMALGAQRESLTWMFVRQGMGLAAIGVVFGIAAAIVSLRLMTSLLFGVSPVDPLTYSLATIAVAAIAWLACYMPSRRASAVNPVNALRAE